MKNQFVDMRLPIYSKLDTQLSSCNLLILTMEKARPLMAAAAVTAASRISITPTHNCRFDPAHAPQTCQFFMQKQIWIKSSLRMTGSLSGDCITIWIPSAA